MLSAAKIVHFDKSVHILKVSSSEPFGRIGVLLDTEKTLHISSPLAGTDGALRQIGLEMKFAENDDIRR